MTNIPFTLTSAFELGLQVTDDIMKDEPEEEKIKARTEFALNFLRSINSNRIWGGKFWI